MKEHKLRSNFIVSLVVFGAAGVLCALVRPVYYANDDAMLRSILSGSFSGSPSAMTVYMNQPLSLLLSLCYHLAPVIPWFDLFQLVCYPACFLAVLQRVIKRMETGKHKWTGGLITTVLYWGLLLRQMLLPTYTVTAAVAAATAVFLTITAEKYENGRAQLKELGGAICWLFICFNLRTNVFLMALPFWGLAALQLLLRENASIKEGAAELKKFLPSILTLSILLLLGILLRCLLYGQAEWKAYLAYNEARTQVYDYTGIASDEESLAAYEKEGLSGETISLYRHYNILLAEDTSLEAMEKIQNLQPQSSISWREAAYLYLQRMTHEKKEYSYLALAAVLYLALFFEQIAPGKQTGQKPKLRYRRLLWLFLLAFMRSLIWMYLLKQGRYPERVTSSLYLLELAFLSGWLCNTVLKTGGKNGRSTFIAGFSLAVILLTAFYTAGSEFGLLREQYRKNTSEIEDYAEIFSYMEANPEMLYLLDVESFPNCPEYVLQGKRTDCANTLLAGGWMVGSPLTDRKLKAYGIESIRQAYLEGKICYVSTKEDSGITLAGGRKEVTLHTVVSGADAYYIRYIEN